MKYALTLGEDGKVLSATYEQYAPIGSVIVDKLPEGDIFDYWYIDNKFIYNPSSRLEVVGKTTPQDDTDAMLVDHEYRLTLLELGVTK